MTCQAKVWDWHAVRCVCIDNSDATNDFLKSLLWEKQELKDHDTINNDNNQSFSELGLDAMCRQ